MLTEWVCTQGQRRSRQAWERGLEVRKREKRDHLEIMFSETKGGGSKVGKHLEELPEQVAFPKIDAKHRESEATLEK